MTLRKFLTTFFITFFLLFLVLAPGTFAEPPDKASSGWFSCVGGSFGEIWGCLSWFITHVIGADNISWY